MPIESGAGVSYVMLGVKDLERSAEFYTETLGRPVRFKTEGLVFIDGGAITIGLSTALGKTREPVVGATEIVFAVENVKASWRALTAKGVQFRTEPRQVTPRDWAATFTDPDGHFLSVFGPEGTIGETLT